MAESDKKTAETSKTSKPEPPKESIVTLMAPEGASSVTIEGDEYIVDDKSRTLKVEARHEETLKAFGYKRKEEVSK